MKLNNLPEFQFIKQLSHNSNLSYKPKIRILYLSIFSFVQSKKNNGSRGSLFLTNFSFMPFFVGFVVVDMVTDAIWDQISLRDEKRR